MAEQGKATQHKRNIELRLVPSQTTSRRLPPDVMGVLLVLGGLSIFWFGIGMLIGWAFL